MKQFEKAIKRIENINFKDIKYDNETNDKESYQLLINEFIRRGNIFKKKFEKKGEKSLAIFSATKILNIEVPDKILERIKGLKLLEKCGWTVVYACESYLEWSYLYDIGNPIAIDNYDLYEPIIKVIERKGIFSYRENLLTCGRYYWPKNAYKLLVDSEEFNISDEYLNQIDS